METKEACDLPLSDFKEAEHVAAFDLMEPDTKSRLEERKASFESVLEALGIPGRYQLTQFALIWVSSAISVCITFSFVFMGYAPPHVCNQVNETQLLISFHLQNDSSATIAYHSCELVIYSNHSGRHEQIADMKCPNGRNFSAHKYTSIVTEWDMVCESAGKPEIVGTLFAAGQIVGGVFASIIADIFGRKLVFAGCSIALCSLELGVLFASNLYVIATFRFFNGIFYRGLNSSGLILAMELRTPRERTFYGIVECIIWVFCALLVGGIAYATQDYGWRGLQIATVIAGLRFPFQILFLKESPRWLTVNNRIKDALNILRVASKRNEKPFHTIRDKYNGYVSQKSLIQRMVNINTNDNVVTSKNKIAEQLCQKETIKNLLIASFIRLTHDLIYYGMYIMSSTLSGDRFLNYCLMALTEIPSNLVLLVMMPRMGRRTIIAIFLSIACASLLVCALMTSFARNSPSFGAVSVASFLIGKLAITTSYNVIYIYIPELFPTKIRAMGATFAVCISRIGSMLAPYTRPFYALVNWGPAVTFVAMSAISLCLTPLLPEMKGVNLKDTRRGLDIKARNSRDTDGDTHEKT